MGGGQMGKWMDGERKDGWMDEWMDGWMDGWLGGWVYKVYVEGWVSMFAFL